MGTVPMTLLPLLRLLVCEEVMVLRTGGKKRLHAHHWPRAVAVASTYCILLIVPGSIKAQLLSPAAARERPGGRFVRNGPQSAAPAQP